MISVKPTLQEFGSMVDEGFEVIPVWQELPADLETPLSIYLRCRQHRYSCLLESVDQHREASRYSFVGFGDELCLDLASEQIASVDLFQELEHKVGDKKVAVMEGLPRFWGGVLGYLGYDVVGQIEPVPRMVKGSAAQLPLAQFLDCRQSIVFDHERQQMYVVVAAFASKESWRTDYEDSCRKLQSLVELIRTPRKDIVVPSAGKVEQKSFVSSWTQEAFEKAVLKAQEHIAAGDIFQIVLSQQLKKETQADSVTLYRALRVKNPSPYMFLLEFDGVDLIGSSPEMLVQYSEETVRTKPIAGTRRRDFDKEVDDALGLELKSDPKEQAEHVMLVDLGRNDIGRVSEFGSVVVPQYMELERFAKVMHLVSVVEGKLRAEHDAIDILKACFPAGTVTGAPKVRAMQLIAELEPVARGPYSGVLAYFGYGGTLDTCILIRTMVKVAESLYLQAGAGVVKDSVPSREWEETWEKLDAVVAAVELAEGGYFDDSCD